MSHSASILRFLCDCLQYACSMCQSFCCFFRRSLLGFSSIQQRRDASKDLVTRDSVYWLARDEEACVFLWLHCQHLSVLGSTASFAPVFVWDENWLPMPTKWSSRWPVVFLLDPFDAIGYELGCEIPTSSGWWRNRPFVGNGPSCDTP